MRFINLATDPFTQIFSNFLLKAQILSWATNTDSCFPWATVSHCSFLKKCLSNIEVWIITGCLPVVCSSEDGVLCKKQLVHLATPPHGCFRAFESVLVLLHSKNSSYLCLITQNQKRCIATDWDLRFIKLIIFVASSEALHFFSETE